jgi:hypothetical protein
MTHDAQSFFSAGLLVTVLAYLVSGLGFPLADPDDRKMVPDTPEQRRRLRLFAGGLAAIAAVLLITGIVAAGHRYSRRRCLQRSCVI